MRMLPLLAMDLPGASDAVKPCRPTVSCTADLAAPGTLEIESGVFASRNESGTRAWSTPFLIKSTVLKPLQIQLTGNGFVTVSPNSRYFDNLAVGPKFQIVDQTNLRPSLAITALGSIPMPEQPGYAPHGHAFFTGHASKDIGAFHLDLNGGVNLWALEGPLAAQGFGAFAVAYALPAPFGVAAEIYGFTNANPLALHDAGLRVYLSASARPWLIFDVGVDAGFFPSTRTFSALFGMSIMPAVLWR